MVYNYNKWHNQYMKNSEETFCITTRKSMDVVEVLDAKGNKILEVAILETRKADVKLGFRASPEFKYVLIRATDELH